MTATRRIRIAPGAVVAVLLASLAAALLVLVAMALLGEYTKTRGRLLLTALTLAGFCVLALAPSILARRGRRLPVAYGGLGASLLGFLLVAAGTWATPDPDAYWKAAGTVSILAGSLFYVCWMLLLEPVTAPARTVALAAAAAASLAGLLAGLAVILEVRAAAFWWVVSVIVLAQVAAGVAAPVLDRAIMPTGKSGAGGSAPAVR